MAQLRGYNQVSWTCPPNQDPGQPLDILNKMLMWQKCTASTETNQWRSKVALQNAATCERETTTAFTSLAQFEARLAIAAKLRRIIFFASRQSQASLRRNFIAKM
jgi:hypothetical protein